MAFFDFGTEHSEQGSVEKNHPIVFVALYSCELQRQFVAPIALAAEILAAKRFGTAASFAWTHFGSFNPTYLG